MELNKIYQGDCLELLKQVESESVDCIVTSPPYNKQSAKRKCGKTDSWQKANIDYGNFKDDLREQEYQEQQKMVLRECLRVLKKDGSIFYNHKPRIVNHKTIFPHEWLSEFNVRQMIVWNRKSSPVLEPIRFMPCVEYIFWITKGTTDSLQWVLIVFIVFLMWFNSFLLTQRDQQILEEIKCLCPKKKSKD